MAFNIPKPTKVPESSWFDHDHNVALTLPFGAVCVADWRFLKAGERYKQNISGFARALSMKAPIMQDIDLKYGTYFVPVRLLCDKTEEIVSMQEGYTSNTLPAKLSASQTLGDVNFDPIDISRQTVQFPFLVFNKTTAANIISSTKASANYASLNDFSKSFLIGGLMDYIGFPVESYTTIKSLNYDTWSDGQDPVGSLSINLLPLKAYHSICNYFFVDDVHRRQFEEDGNLVDIKTSQVGYQSISDVEDLFKLRYTTWESDYFTKASYVSRNRRIFNASAGELGQGTDNNLIPNIDVINADTIRGMFQLDEFARKAEMFWGNMRKQIKLMFGIVSSDKSAMSPILLDAGSCAIQVSEITNVAGGPAILDQGAAAPGTNVAPLGITAGKMTAGFGKSYEQFLPEELGIVMTLVWIRPRTAYLNRVDWQLFNYLESSTIPNPLFAQIGQTPIYEHEIAYRPWDARPAGNNNTPTDIVFGWNYRYVQEKMSMDSFKGDFRDNLIYWHTAREFSPDSLPSAGFEFSQLNPKYPQNNQPLNRIFNVVEGIDGNRPFQVQLRFKTEIWQPYPHIDGEK